MLRSRAPGGNRAARFKSRHWLRAWTTLAAAGALAFSGLMAATSASAQQSPTAHMASLQHVTGHLHAVPGHHDYAAACARPTRGHAACMALVRTNVKPHQAANSIPNAIPAGVGYGPSQLQSAYVLPSSTAGSGETVAVVDAFNDPNAASDLATYRSDAGLPACGTGCFSVVNENGATSPLPASAGTSGWDVEESLDIDMVSAICPLCHIILVETNSASINDLGTGVNAAVSLGAKFVSNSYGGSESSTDSSLDSQFYNHAGVAVTASAGDSGFGVSYPAASQFVTSVGGTSLSTASNSRGWTESVWNGSGGGCSADDAKPSWQTDTGCSRRTDNDVAAVADPNTGVAVFDTFSQGGWLEVGGTSASSPIIASVFALAGNPAAGTYPSSYIYQHTSNLFDVTSGSNGSCSPSYLCTAGAGYDGPTGWGTPDGTAAFTNGSGTGGNTVTVASPGSQSGTVGTATSLQMKATDSQSGQTFTWSASGLPTGLAINSTSGLISGTPSASGTFTVTVTATDTTGAKGSVTFTWTISTAGGGCTAAQLFGNPGFETGSLTPWSATAGVLNNTSAGVPAHSGSWLAWLDGYGTAHTDTLSQKVTIPANCKNATLSFWLDINTNAASASAGDTFTVQVLNSAGTVVSTLGTFSNQQATSGYVQHSFSVSSFIGQTITIKFTGKETLGGGFDTNFFEDDNALNVS